MRKKTLLVQTLCQPYCSYYKSGKNEELVCRGAVVVERLVEKGIAITPVKSENGPGPEIVEQVIQYLCAACDFKEQDCDFMQDRKARPCGGFILIGLLLASGAIRVADIA